MAANADLTFLYTIKKIIRLLKKKKNINNGPKLYRVYNFILNHNLPIPLCTILGITTRFTDPLVVVIRRYTIIFSIAKSPCKRARESCIRHHKRSHSILLRLETTVFVNIIQEFLGRTLNRMLDSRHFIAIHHDDNNMLVTCNC